MAVFVENTMQVAKVNDQKIAAARHQEQTPFRMPGKARAKEEKELVFL